MPTEENWPGFKRLPNAKSLRLPRTQQKYTLTVCPILKLVHWLTLSANLHSVGAVIRAKFPFLTASGSNLLTALLSLDPAKRPTATEFLTHPYFREDPKPKSSAVFPTFPSKAGQEKRRRIASPSAPKRGEAPRIDGDVADFRGIFAGRENEEAGAGFSLKLI